MQHIDERRLKTTFLHRDVGHNRRMTLILDMLAQMEKAMVASGHIHAGTLRRAIDHHMAEAVAADRAPDKVFVELLNRHFPDPSTEGSDGHPSP